MHFSERLGIAHVKSD